MEKIGEITFSTLEKDVEKEWSVLDVIRNPSSESGLTFKKINGLERRIKRYVSKLDQVMSDATTHFQTNYAPFFEDPQICQDILEDIVCNRTFFERSDCFDNKHDPKIDGKEIKAAGLNYPSGRNDYYGSFVRLNRKDSMVTTSSTLIHEYGHAMHEMIFQYLPILSDYVSSDAEMKEVFAISATRTKYKGKYNKPPHKTANDLIIRLEKISEYAKLPFHKRWFFLLNYTNHETLKEHIELLEELALQDYMIKIQ